MQQLRERGGIDMKGYALLQQGGGQAIWHTMVGRNQLRDLLSQKVLETAGAAACGSGKPTIGCVAGFVMCDQEPFVDGMGCLAIGIAGLAS